MRSYGKNKEDADDVFLSSSKSRSAAKCSSLFMDMPWISCEQLPIYRSTDERHVICDVVSLRQTDRRSRISTDVRYCIRPRISLNGCAMRNVRCEKFSLIRNSDSNQQLSKSLTDCGLTGLEDLETARNFRHWSDSCLDAQCRTQRGWTKAKCTKFTRNFASKIRSKFAKKSSNKVLLGLCIGGPMKPGTNEKDLFLKPCNLV